MNGNNSKIKSLVNFVLLTSSRRILATCKLKSSTVHKNSKKDFHMKHYLKRLDFRNRIETMFHVEELDPDDKIFSDESHTYLVTSPNKQSIR